MFIPILISLMFVAAFIRFHVYPNQKSCKYMVALIIVMLFISWYYNVCADGVYDNCPYYTEYYGTGFAETGSLIIATLLVFIALFADMSMTAGTKSVAQPHSGVTDGLVTVESETPVFTTSDFKRFCPDCGAAITDPINHKYCPACGRNLRDWLLAFTYP